MPVALQLLNSYLRTSEAFIWYSLRNMRRYRPLVVASEKLNLAEFPLENGAILDGGPRKNRLAALRERIRGGYAPDDYGPCLGAIRTAGPDVLHAHYGYRGMAAMALAEQLQRPLITTFYGFDVSLRAYLRRAARGYARLFSLGSCFLVEGPAMRRRLEHLGCPREKITVHRIAIPVEKYAFRARSWDGRRPVQFLFIGRMVEKKGLADALRALSGVQNRFSWSLMVIGDGPLRPSLESLAAGLGLSSQVIFLGTRPPSELPGHMESADVLLQPSRTARDGDAEGGAPTTLLEAQAAGLPIVATNHDDIPYVVRAGENAMLSIPADAQSLRENIFAMVEAHPRWPAMSRAGRSHVESRHAAAALTPALEGIYDSLVQSGRPP